MPDNHASVLLESIISTPSILPSIVEHTAKLLIKEALSQDNAEKAAVARSLLSNIQQRHPEVFQRVTQAQQDDEELKKSIDKLVLSLSLVGSDDRLNGFEVDSSLSQVSTAGSQSKEVDMVLASTSADTNIRVIAVKELLSSLSNSSLTTADQVGHTSMIMDDFAKIVSTSKLSRRRLSHAFKILNNKSSKLSTRGLSLSHPFSQLTLRHASQH